MITGVRGCGKTVFITQIAHRLREKPEWIVVDLNAQRDMLYSLAAKLASHQILSQWFQEAEINLQAFGAAFVWIAALWALILMMIFSFWVGIL